MLLGPERISDAQKARAALLKKLIRSIRRVSDDTSKTTMLAAQLVLACKKETGIDPLDGGHIKGAEDFEE